MKGDETYCVYIEKSHAVFLIFTLFIVIIIAVISESIAEACKFLIAAGIPVMLILTMGCGPIAKHMRNRPSLLKKQGEHTEPADRVNNKQSLVHAAPETRPPRHGKHRADHHESDTSSDSSSDSDSDEYIRTPARRRRAYKGSIDYEDRFIKHGSIGPYHTYDIKSADDYMTHKGPLRNDPRREKQGIINHRRALRKYYEDDHDEHRDWWGDNDY